MKKIFLVALLSILALLGVVLLPWLVFIGTLILSPSPSDPEIKECSFPFVLTYELNGELKEIEDTVICKYEGIVLNDDRGKKRQWSEKLKSGNENVKLLDLRSSGIKNNDGKTILELYFFYGNAPYYMGDKNDTRARAVQSLDKVCYSYMNEDGRVFHSSYSTAEAQEKFGLRIVSWECAPPIENSFK